MTYNYDFRLDSIETGGATGMDAFFANEPAVVSPVGTAKEAAAPVRVKVGSLSQLQGFTRVSSDTLINKSTNDLWAIRKDGDEFQIERLFSDSGSPLKG